MIKKMLITYNSKILKQTESFYFDNFYYWINYDRVKCFMFFYLSGLTDAIARWESECYYIMKNEQHYKDYIKYNKFDEKIKILQEDNMIVYNQIVTLENELEEMLLELRNIENYEEILGNVDKKVKKKVKKFVMK